MPASTIADILAAAAHPLRVRAHGHGSLSVTPPSVEVLNFKTNDVPGTVFATPPTGAGGTCDRTTTGALALPTDPASSRYFRILRARQNYESSSGLAFALLSDRLVAASGIVANSAAVQTINTTALPARATGGDGVHMALECHSAGAGGSNPVLTVVYVNQAGTTQTTTLQLGSTWTGSFSPGANERLMIPLVAGDTGVRSITSVQSNSAGTSAGNYGVVLYKPIAMFGLTANGQPTSLGLTGAGYDVDWLRLGLPKIDPQACVEVVGESGGTLASLNLLLELMVDG